MKPFTWGSNYVYCGCFLTTAEMRSRSRLVQGKFNKAINVHRNIPPRISDMTEKISLTVWKSKTGDFKQQCSCISCSYNNMCAYIHTNERPGMEIQIQHPSQASFSVFISSVIWPSSPSSLFTNSHMLTSLFGAALLTPPCPWSKTVRRAGNNNAGSSAGAATLSFGEALTQINDCCNASSHHNICIIRRRVQSEGFWDAA